MKTAAQRTEHSLELPPRLSPQEIRFERTAGGLVRAILAHAHVEPVDFYRAFPFADPDDLISVRDMEGQELGILAPLATFPGHEAQLIRSCSAVTLLPGSPRSCSLTNGSGSHSGALTPRLASPRSRSRTNMPTCGTCPMAPCCWLTSRAIAIASHPGPSWRHVYAADWRPCSDPYGDAPEAARHGGSCLHDRSRARPGPALCTC